jgi:MFS family permease
MSSVGARVRAARRGVTVIFLLNGVLFGAWATRIPAVKGRLELGEGALGVALALIAVGALSAMPLAGWLSARHGSRWTTRLAAVAFCVATPLPALAPSYPLLMLACFALGASGGALDVAMNTHGVAVEQRHPRPILSSLHAAFSAGGLIGAATGSLAAGLGIDARTHLITVAALALAAVPFAGAALLPRSADVAEEGAPLLVRPPRRLWALGVIGLCGLLAEGASADWSAVYVNDSLEAGAGVAGLAFAAFSLTMTAGRLAGDRLTSAWGPERLVRRGGLLGAAGLGAALLISEPAAAIVGFACLGAGLAGIVPTIFRAAGTTPGIAPGVALAAVSTAGYTGFLAGPPLIGGLAQATSLPPALGLVAVLGLVIAALASSVPAMAPAHSGGIRRRSRAAPRGSRSRSCRRP